MLTRPLQQFLVSVFFLDAFHLADALDSTASVTIDQLTAYTYQRTCGKGCLQNNYDNGDDIEYELGCTYNGCYCASYHRSSASSIVKSCWAYYCGTKEADILSYDISTALSIYDAYCGFGEVAATTTGNNAPMTSVSLSISIKYSTVYSTATETITITEVQEPNPSTITIASTTVQVSVTVISTITVAVPSRRTTQSLMLPTITVTVTNKPSATTTGPQVSPAPQYSLSDQIALGVGLGLGIPTLLVTIWLCCVQTRRRVAARV